MSLAVTVNGIRWLPYEVEFDTAEGKFTVELFAVSRIHALERLEELKATARLTGWEIIGKSR
jgi:hypothetical protein